MPVKSPRLAVSHRTRAAAIALSSTTRAPLLIDGNDRQFRQFIDNLLRLSARMQTLRAALASWE